MGGVGRKSDIITLFTSLGVFMNDDDKSMEQEKLIRQFLN